MKTIPLVLTSLRFFLAPVLLWLAWAHPNRIAFGTILIAAFLSDVFDGILARRLGVATPALRRLDSTADSAFYIAATCAVWHLDRTAITTRLAPLLILAAFEITRYAFDFIKFRREASYDMWSSKLWGLLLFAAFFSLLALDRDGIIVSVAVYLGIVADGEGLIISIVLKQWQNDVPTLFHALRTRRRQGLANR